MRLPYQDTKVVLLGYMLLDSLFDILAILLQVHALVHYVSYCKTIQRIRTTRVY